MVHEIKSQNEVSGVYEGMSALREAGFRIRPMADGDLGGIRELRSVVGWSADPEAFDLLRGMRGAGWAVAQTRGAEISGMVGAVSLGEVGILCHLAVHDEHRGLGLGATLTSWAVTYLKSRGAKTIRLYTTPEAEKLYRSFGFESVANRAVYRLEEPRRKDWSRREADGYRVETLLFEDLPELYGLDLWSYGADRSHLILATLRLRPGRSLIARDSSGRTTGYLILSSSRSETRIGPFMAANKTVARLLLANAIEARVGELVQLTVPGGNEKPHELLDEFGFSGRAERLQMELGNVGNHVHRGLEQYATTAYLAT